jgi:hypothetical protein
VRLAGPTPCSRRREGSRTREGRSVPRGREAADVVGQLHELPPGGDLIDVSKEVLAHAAAMFDVPEDRPAVRFRRLDSARPFVVLSLRCIRSRGASAAGDWLDTSAATMTLCSQSSTAICALEACMPRLEASCITRGSGSVKLYRSLSSTPGARHVS